MRAQSRDLAAREAKLEALQQQLTASVGELVTGEDWKRALEFAARFRSRSFNNTMLIYVQHHAAYQQGRVPEPTQRKWAVSGLPRWTRQAPAEPSRLWSRTRSYSTLADHAQVIEQLLGFGVDGRPTRGSGSATASWSSTCSRPPATKTCPDVRGEQRTTPSRTDDPAPTAPHPAPTRRQGPAHHARDHHGRATPLTW